MAIIVICVQLSGLTPHLNTLLILATRLSEMIMRDLGACGVRLESSVVVTASGLVQDF